jgi:prolyl-tRNA editing enzyme YbaK/EbsC (Cys-tRNA(Pro) deacylase)
MEGAPDMTDLPNPGPQRLVEVASRKGVTLDIRTLPRAARTAAEAAMAIGADLGQMVRSVMLVAPRPGGRLLPIVCLVSGRDEVDLRLLEAVAGEVALRAASAREVRELTGYAANGVPPFGHGRDVRVVMDQDLSRNSWLWAAAGTDVAVFRVSPQTLRMLSNAVVAPVADGQWMRTHAGTSAEPKLRFGAGAGA